jgi:hypothetical protein
VTTTLPPGFTPFRARRPVAVAARAARSGALGLARGARGWPGVDATAAAYAVAVTGLRAEPYPQLLGALCATFVAVAWYGSPMRRWEASRRRARGSAGHTP